MTASCLDSNPVITGAPVGLWAVDLRSNQVQLNPACAELLGIDTGDEPLNLARFLSRLKPKGLKNITARWNAAMASVQGEFVSEHAIGPTDHPRWLLTKAAVSQRDSSGNPVLVTGFCLDISERKAREQTLLRGMSESEAILNMAPTAVAILHGDVMAGCNRAMEDLFGYPMRQLIGSPPELLFVNGTDWRVIANTVPLLSDRGSTELGEIECQSCNGRRFWAQVSGRCMGNAEDRIFTFTDISRPRELASALAAARDAAEAASKAKSDFLATMSHEIRTPMNGVLGMLELLERSRLDGDQREALNTARESATDMLRLIGDILDFSKIEARRIDIQKAPVSLAVLASRSAALYETMASAKGLVLRCNVDSNFPALHLADGLRISQILNNLLSNAIKFTERGTIRLTLGLEGKNRHGDRVIFRVVDTGIGIDPEKQKRLFQPFVQADSGTTRKYGGSGLGLAISLQLAELMGGSIQMSSQPGRGTSVKVRMTLERAEKSLTPERQRIESPGVTSMPKAGRARSFTRAAGAPGKSKPAPVAAATRVILVVEDHPVNRTLLQRQVELLGFRSVAAKDGQEGLELWRKGGHDLVICDCHMPRLDGYDLARAIRREEQERPGRPPSILIACTANTRPEDAALCIESGMNDCLFKPVSLQALQEKIEHWLPLSKPSQIADQTTRSP